MNRSFVWKEPIMQNTMLFILIFVFHMNNKHLLIISSSSMFCLNLRILLEVPLVYHFAVNVLMHCCLIAKFTKQVQAFSYPRDRSFLSPNFDLLLISEMWIWQLVMNLANLPGFPFEPVSKWSYLLNSYQIFFRIVSIS